MNCDLVFEILTRGPFPSGDPTDASVEVHLARCHDCRRLAEALRPAVELFHETLSFEGETDSLPGYYGALRESEDSYSTAVADLPLWSEPLENMEPAPNIAPLAPATWGDALHRAGQWAGGMLLGMVACFVLAVLLVQTTSPGDRPGAGAPHAPLPVLAATAPHGDEVRAMLASLQLPGVCLMTKGEAPPSDAPADSREAEQLLCCTHCHNAARSHRPPVSAVALLQREACVACHHFE